MIARFAFYLKHDGAVVMPFVVGPRQFEYADAFSYIYFQGEKMFAIEIKNRRHGAKGSFMKTLNLILNAFLIAFVVGMAALILIELIF